MTAERAEERSGNGLADHEQRDADRKRYPQRLRGESCRALLLTFNFLTYGTTAVVARATGAAAICGRPRWPTIAVSART